MMDKNTVVWVYSGEPHECERLYDKLCPVCSAQGAIVALPPPLREKQPDGTTHVCHPNFGGCNHGFAEELTAVQVH